MVECELTGMANPRLLTTLSDGHTIAYGIYKMTSNLLGKGVITMSDVHSAETLIAERDDLVNQLANIIRRGAIPLGITNTDLIKVIHTFENEKSISLFKKDRPCMDIHEHIEVLKLSVAEYGKLNLSVEPLEDKNKLERVKGQYLGDLSYEQRMLT